MTVEDPVVAEKIVTVEGLVIVEDAAEGPGGLAMVMEVVTVEGLVTVE